MALRLNWEKRSGSIFLLCFIQIKIVQQLNRKKRSIQANEQKIADTKISYERVLAHLRLETQK
jgi:hypothetical protein